MTKKETEYLDLLRGRLAITEARLRSTPVGASFYHEIERERNALKWVIRKLEEMA